MPADANAGRKTINIPKHNNYPQMNRGQGSIEYLLILGGVIMVAVIVVSLLVNIATPTGTQTKNDTADLFCSRKALNDCCNNTVTVQGQPYNCTIDAAKNRCAWDKENVGGDTTVCRCNNGVQGGNETDIDCGGLDCTGIPTPQKCSLGKSCSIAGDCKSGFCPAGTCTSS